MSSAPTQNEDSRAGFVYALMAYGLWGFLPLYLKALEHIGPAEVVAHRIIWSVPVAGALLWATGRTQDIRAALTSPRMLAMGAVTAGLISINWGIYVWAIAADRALDGALGYYINPLFSIAMGALVLGERLTRLQYAAVGLAALAVLVLTVEAGGLPWVALALTTSFGFYALAKRALPIGPNQGFLLEVLILLPFALGYVVWLEARGVGALGTGSLSDWALLVGCGIVTAVPLLFYANGAKLLRLSTIAMLQYIAPTMIMLIAVFVFEEPFGSARAVAFPLIWAGLALYSVSLLRRKR